MSLKAVTIGRATLYLGDCREVLPTLGKVDSVITDPPYSDRTHKGHDAGARPGADRSRRAALGYGSFSEQDVAEYVRAATAICAGWIVTMTDHTLAPALGRALEADGRYVFAPLPFYAPGSRVRLCGDGPSSWTIWIVVARTSAQSRWGTLPGGYIAEPGWRDREHMGGKPTALMERLVADYSRPGQIVIDPYMGAGTTGVACHNMGRRFVGIERDRGAFDKACERIENAQRQERFEGFA